jgi:hypothetical protein
MVVIHMRLGNDAPSRFATDIVRWIARSSLRGWHSPSTGGHRCTFVGASATAMPAPFVNALNQDQAIGVLQAERDLSPTLRLRHTRCSRRADRAAGDQVGESVGPGGRRDCRRRRQPAVWSASMAVKREKPMFA